MALLASSRGACVRRRTGCVLTDSRHHVLATGYNGRPSGMLNCLEEACAGSKSASGTNLEGCEAIHAEANAIIQCAKPFEIVTAYCTTAPCVHCVKLLLNTGCKRIVFFEDYPHSAVSKDLAERAGVEWVKYQNG